MIQAKERVTSLKVNSPKLASLINHLTNVVVYIAKGKA